MCEHKRNIIAFLVIAVLVCNIECDFVFAENNGEVIRCMEREREALLKFKEGLTDKNGMLSSWGRRKECCKWEGVRCSNTTGHVIGIELVGSRSANNPRYNLPDNISVNLDDHINYQLPDNNNYYLGGEISSALQELHNLNVLNLSGNDFEGNKFPKCICSMTQLKHLDLSVSRLFGALPSEIENLTNLRTLDLSYNLFSETLPSEIGKLNNLRILDLSTNNFFGTLPSEIGNLTKLRTLDLSYNHFFSGTLPTEIGNLINLHTLVLMHNKFFGIVPPQLWSLTKLKDLDLSKNDLTSSATDTIFNMSTNHVAPCLRTLNLQNNKMKSLPSCIWQFSKLEELVASYNSLEDTITEANFAKLHNLKTLYLSFNSLTLDISPDWSPPFQLSEIGLSGCKVGPHFPSWLRTNNSFWNIDLSNNGISGEVPKWFWTLSHEVKYLNLSNNQLSGAFSDFSSINIEIFDVSANNFSGPLPLLSTSIIIFQFSQNMFSGPLSFMCSVPYQYQIVVLDLSDNQLEGKLPNCWEQMTELFVLNLANNNFSGEIPHALGYLPSLRSLHLANNKFSGEFPSNLKNCKQLQLIDIGDNMLTGSIPTLIGEYHYTMVYLILRNNRFQGGIPTKICYLSRIQVLDMSGNNISGTIPPCFNNFTHFVTNIPSESTPVILGSQIYRAVIIEYVTVLWKHAESEYRRNHVLLIKLIDLSHNRLVGHIPSSFSSLKELNSLNLSRNRLTGNIDPGIGQMRSLESLDLSSNQLSGEIPAGIAQLNFLSVLDLSNNSFSGKIPIATQLQTFPASAYSCNIRLCGSPLPPCPGDRLNPPTHNEARNVDDSGILSLSFLKEYGISIILGFIFGFWGVVGPLIVKESWRRIFYNFFGTCGDWLFVRAAIFWRKLKRGS